jgi:hypothetical protein
METLTVYAYEEWDRGERRWRRAARIGTLDAIASMNGVAIMSSEMVIDPSRVGADGFVIGAEALAGRILKAKSEPA